MNFLKLFFLIFSALFAQSTLGLTLSCAHQAPCLLAKEVLEKTQSISLNNIVTPVGDPHHYHPGQKEIKQLLDAQYLLAPPAQLWPWLNPIVKKRNSESTYSLTSRALPIKGNKESLAHFWLHPKLICFHKMALSSHLKDTWKLSLVPFNCDREENIQKRFNKLKQKFKDSFLVLTHDALTPLLAKTFTNLVSIRSSHHGDSISPKTIKSLEDFLNSNQKSSILWIVEDQIEIPAKIKKKIRTHDKVIKIKTTLDKRESIYEVLEELLSQLESH